MNDETGEDSLGNMEISRLRKVQVPGRGRHEDVKKKKKKATYVPWKTLSTGTSPFFYLQFYHVSIKKVVKYI